MSSSKTSSNEKNNDETKTTIYSMLTGNPITIPDSYLFGACR